MNNLLVIISLGVSLLNSSIEDFSEQSINLRELSLPAVIAFYLFYRDLTTGTLAWPDLLSGMIMTLVMLVLIYRQKMGLGDLLWYLIIGLAFDFTRANLILLTACFFFLVAFLLHKIKRNQPVGFLPFLFIGYVINFIFWQ